MRFATCQYSAALTTALALLAAVSARRYPDSDADSGQKQKVMSGSGRGDARSNPLDDDFAAFARAALERWHVPGIAVAVVDGDETWTEGYGISRFPSTPVTPSTLFYGGSTTKAFTAAVVAQLIASGEHSTTSGPLNWRTPLAQLLGDDFALAPEYGWAAAHLTLEDALSHRTGFPRHDKALGRRYYSADDGHAATVRDVARSLRYLPMVSEPRVEWRYCNVMYMVVSHAVQVLTNEWLGDVMRDRIWAPLGMNDTFLSVEEAMREGRVVADGYYWDYKGEGKGGFVEVPKLGLGLASGAGGVVSNVGDYARWVRCLIRGDKEGDGDGEGCTVLPKEAHRELKTARIVQGPESKKGYDAPLAYALGWEVGTYKGHRLFKHSGGMEAYGALVYFFPDLEYGVVTLANTAVTSNIVGQELIWKLVDDKLGIPKEDRYDWAGLGDKTIQQALKQPETAVEELYPERANPPLPRTLPLQEYVGVYSHPAYQNITIELVDGVDISTTKSSAKAKRKGAELKANRGNMEWQMMFEFIHVSGEFWAVVIDMLNTPNSLNGQLARAEFVVGVKGGVDKLKMEFLEDGSEGIIVFDRVA